MFYAVSRRNMWWARFWNGWKAPLMPSAAWRKIRLPVREPERVKLFRYGRSITRSFMTFFMVNVYPICYKIICAAYQFVCAKEYDTK